MKETETRSEGDQSGGNVSILGSADLDKAASSGVGDMIDDNALPVVETSNGASEDEHSFVEIVVGSNDGPGKNVTRNLRGRRFSYTVPRGARSGDVLRVRIPNAALAIPLENGGSDANGAGNWKADNPRDAKVRTRVSEIQVNAWLYKDADGVVFGPFEASLMASWFREDMIPANLLVRPADNEDAVFKEIDVLFAERIEDAFC